MISYPVISEKVKAEPVSADNIAFINIQDDNFAIKADIPTVIVTPFSKVNSGNLCIKIKPISVGIGLNRGISFEELQRDLLSFSQENSLQIEDIDVFHLLLLKKTNLD
ncbi:MAG: hypothetical protein MZU97_01670 [Bacillus subtilis]|nr:hypothetical protein [Bacillus subtilis]